MPVKKIINQIPMKSRGKTYRTFRFEVGVFHTEKEDEVPEIKAKFKSYGDAMVFANHIASGNVWYYAILIQ